jgi:hypothetical protein
MNVNSEEYTTKLKQFVNGEISEEEWKEYCTVLLEEIMEDAKDVFIRMKERVG